MKRLLLSLPILLLAGWLTGCTGETEPVNPRGVSLSAYGNNGQATLRATGSCNAGEVNHVYFRYRLWPVGQYPWPWQQTSATVGCPGGGAFTDGPFSRSVSGLTAGGRYVYEACEVEHQVCVGATPEDVIDLTKPMPDWYRPPPNGTDDEFTVPSTPTVQCNQGANCPPPPDVGAVANGAPPDVPDGAVPSGLWRYFEVTAQASGAGACVTGTARWFARNAFGDLLYSIKMKQRSCTGAGGKQVKTDPTIFPTVTKLGHSTGWSYDCGGGNAACGGGYKVLGDAGQTEITQTKRITRFIRCVPFSGQTICPANPTYVLRNIFSSWPSGITVRSYPHNN